ncbi:hypothetical protein LINPERPRIM_LOCUS7717 [Linum perenne]
MLRRRRQHRHRPDLLNPAFSALDRLPTDSSSFNLSAKARNESGSRQIRDGRLRGLAGGGEEPSEPIEEEGLKPSTLDLKQRICSRFVHGSERISWICSRVFDREFVGLRWWALGFLLGRSTPTRRRWGRSGLQASSRGLGSRRMVAAVTDATDFELGQRLKQAVKARPIKNPDILTGKPRSDVIRVKQLEIRGSSGVIAASTTVGAFRSLQVDRVLTIGCILAINGGLLDLCVGV